ncbi:hypothetical protein DYQ93_11565 [Xanthomonas sp. LMG 8992]|uniref:hypothetical protein n=1 Tax=Xanthomonas sp. LMG 8992 TaxID=1591157 RepID=UPI00136A7F3D|nr:hypothetical protein [Xanthomonas sp. LMG 8992]MXV11658.1 hypothetical protein [Xanthomonas sp. LMG 8992]
MSDATDWTKWFATGHPGGGWKMVRFERVDADGKPVGKPLESATPTGRLRLFRTEADAARHARYLNIEEGRA